MRKAGASYALIPLAVLIIGIAFLAGHSTSYAVQTFNPIYSTENCDDLADDGDITNSSCVTSPGENVTAGAATDQTTHVSWLTPDGIFSFYATGNPPDSFIAPSTDIALNDVIGVIENTPKLGLGNGACNVTPGVPFTFFNASIDVTDLTSSLPEGFVDRHGILMMEDSLDDDGDGVYSEDGNLNDESPGTIATGTYYTAGDDDGDTLINEDPPDNNNGGLPNHVAYYISWLNDHFDPDLDGLKLDPAANGPQPPLVPHARYSGMALVLGVPVILQLVQFAPDQLTGFPAGHPFNETAGMGWVNQVILQDTLEVVTAPSAISSFCETQSHTLLLGQVGAIDSAQDLAEALDTTETGVDVTSAAPFSVGDHIVVNADEFMVITAIAGDTLTVRRGLFGTLDTHANGADVFLYNANDRFKNAPENTGLVDPATGVGTNTHLTITYTTSGRNLDGDTIPNNDTYDTCATVANPNWDPTINRPVPGQASDSDSDGIPEIVVGSGDDVLPVGIGPEDPCDNAIVFPPVFDHESTPESNCVDNVDDDKDGRVNDNCPVVGADPEINQCDNADDDDGDGDVNDGCPVVLAVSEASIPGACANDFDDDFDFRVNDGCPANGNAEVQQCNEPEGAAVNDDAGDDGVINDGCFRDILLAQDQGDLFLNGDDNCPILYNPLQTQGENSQTWAFATDIDADTIPDGGSRNDSMGDPCDPNPDVADGPYLARGIIDAICITPGTDSDGDGFCDATETALGSNPGLIGSTPENDAVQPPFPLGRGTNGGLGATGGVPTPCSDGVDNDGDGDIDGLDSGCGSTNDGDEDGLADVGGPYTDNCPGNDALPVGGPVNVAAYNPTQTDTDGDGLGDACDDDVDGDGRTQTHERWTGHDVMDDCPNNTSHDAWPFDTNNSGNVNLVDLVGTPSFKDAFGKSQGDALYFRQFDFNASGNVNLVDLVGTPGSFKSSFGTSC